jgi:phospholipid/cholesterol/gamma-HCH transport system substrate-binding protein
VGIMAIVAMVLLAVLVFLLTSSTGLFVKKATIHTYMSDSAALAVGAPVRLNGILIGNVSHVGLSGLKQPDKIVEIDMSVDYSKLKDIPVDSEAGISAENVLGTKFINIEMGTSSQTIKPGGTLSSKSTMEFEEVVQSGYNVMVSAQTLVKRMNAIVDEIESGKGSLGKFIVDPAFYNRLTATVTETEKIASAINSGKGTVGRLIYDEKLYDDVRASVNRLDAILQNMEQGRGTAGKLLNDPALYDDARKTMAEIKSLVANLNAGKGTAGKLLTDEQLYRRIDALVAKLDTTMSRINSGQGTLGQLLVNPNLYESLDGFSRELEGLIKDFRANPKKFLRIKLAIF